MLFIFSNIGNRASHIHNNTLTFYLSETYHIYFYNATLALQMIGFHMNK